MKRILVAILCLILLAGCNFSRGNGGGKTLPTVIPAIQTALSRALSKQVFGHVVIIVMENTSKANAIKSSYFKQLMDEYAYADAYFGITHPSLPNYLALTGGDTYGIQTDCKPGSDCSISGTGTNIADQLEAAGLSWKAYIEDMPEPCTTSGPDTYMVHHNPFIYFDDIRDDTARCAAHDVPFGLFNTDLANGDLPNFAWISPNRCNSMHNQCESGVPLIQQGADFLSTWVPKILDSKQFQDDGVLIITFDEAKDEDTTGCCGVDPGGGQVLTLIISNYSKVKSGGFSSSTPFNHYSLLKTIEDNWGLGYIKNSNGDQVAPMWDFFNR